MQIIHTADFKNNTILAERGVKCIIRGYAFVKDTKNWLKKKYQARYDFDEIALNDLLKNCELVTDEDKTDPDILNNLFDLTYEPCLELSVPEIINDEANAILGGERFGTYKIRVNSALNNKTRNGIQGKYKAIVLIGEKYTENDLYVSSLNKSYLAMILYFGVGQQASSHEIMGEDGGLEIGEADAFTINLQFSLSNVTPDVIESTSGFGINLNDDFAKILDKTEQKDQTTTQLAIEGAFLVPSGKEYKTKLELENGKTVHNENVMFIDKTLNLIPDTSKNNNIFNVTPKVNIFDDHKDKINKPQMLLSYGELVGDTFKTQSIGFEYDPFYFKLNEKAPEGNTRFDLFGGSTKRENEAYNDEHYAMTSGYLRLLSNRGHHYSGENDMFIAANDNDVGMNDGSMILSNANTAISAGNGNDDPFATSDAHFIKTNETSAVGLSGGALIDSERACINRQDHVMMIGAQQSSATISAGAYKPTEDNPYISAENTSGENVYPYGSPGQIGMIGMNASSMEFNGHGNIFIGHKGLLSNFGHDAVVFGNYNACGNKEYDICESCSGTGRVTCTACVDETGHPTGKIGQNVCTACSGYGTMIDPECNGVGFIEGYAHPRKTMECPVCKNTSADNCSACSGSRVVKYQPTIAYEDGCVMKVGDGYFRKNLMKNQNTFDMYDNFINITPENNCDLDIGPYLKRMNLFSVEKHGALTVHNNNYDTIPDSNVKHMIAEDFFAIRGWAKYDELSDRFANLQNGCYSPEAIYFSKRTTHNETWKLRVSELNDFIHDNYIKSSSVTLKTDVLNQAISDFYKNNNTYILKLGPIITYRWDAINGAKGAKGTTVGIIGAKGLSGLKGLCNTAGYKGKELKILDMRYKYYIEDILKAIRAEYGKTISNSSNLGKNPETYTFYCINCDPTKNLYFKGIRLRTIENGNYQTLYALNAAEPANVQRIIYKDNGYYGDYGVMNFNYAKSVSRIS